MKNKKILLIISILGIMSFGIMASNLKYSLFINGNKMDANIIIENNTTYVPLRMVSEQLGANVEIKDGGIYVTSNTDLGIENVRPTDEGGDNVGTRYNSPQANDTIKLAKEVLGEDIVIENDKVYRIVDGEKEDTGYVTFSYRQYLNKIKREQEKVNNKS